jgi:thioredoxin-disulfide reductase
MYDTIIVGGGPSALTAGIYLGRFRRKTLILAESLGGQTAISGTIENYPGSEAINGLQLINQMEAQVKKQSDVEIKVSEKVAKIIKADDHFEVQSSGDKYDAKSVIIATGKRHRKLGLPNEGELIGRGISYCATCDGPFARDKDVIVVGGGYAAVEGAILISKNANAIKMIVMGEELDCENISIEKINANKKIEKIFDTKVTEILSENGFVTGVKTENVKTGETSEIEGKIVFVEIGQIPNSEIFADLVEIKKGEIVISKENETSVSGIFACGDVTDVVGKQTIIACGEGAKAAISANEYLEKDN